MDPTTIFDAAKLLTAGGTTLYFAVQLVKAFGYSSPRATVATAVAGAFALTALFAFSDGLLAPRYAFDLVVAAFAVAATGAGIHAMANATAKG